MARNNQIEVNGIDIKYKKINKTDYISLTDIARYANPKEPKVPIQTWMRNKDVISYFLMIIMMQIKPQKCQE